jgi:hypothetical protein
LWIATAYPQAVNEEEQDRRFTYHGPCRLAGRGTGIHSIYYAGSLS